jgi:hypothetical protein
MARMTRIQEPDALCHPFVALRASSERVGPVKYAAARIQREISLHVEG